MTHDEARELIGAVPGEVSAELEAHLKTCPECRTYREQMLALDAKLRRALELDWHKIAGTAPPGGPMPKPPVEATQSATGPARGTVTPLTPKARDPQAKHTRPRLFALAASVAAALTIGGVLWLS